MAKHQESTDVTAEQGFSAYERRLFAEVDRILYQNYLTPRTVTDFWQGDRDGVVEGLKALKVRAVRIIVLSHYVEIDGALGMIIYKHLVPKGKAARKQKTIRAMIDGMHVLQKLEAVETFRKITTETKNAIRAINQLRNTMAHRYGMSPVPVKDRKYKGKHDVFGAKGLKKMRDDMHNVDVELQPYVMEVAMALVAEQKKISATRVRERRSAT